MKKLRELIDHLRERFTREKKVNLAELLDVQEMVVKEMERMQRELDKKQSIKER